MRQVVRRVGLLRTAVHRVVFTRSRGRLLRSWGGLPALELTTTGRVSGRPVRTMLVAVSRDGERLVVAASDGGADRDPQWYRNLCAHPAVDVLIDGRIRPMTARTVDAAERAGLWPDVVSRSPAYGRYQARTRRVVPLVALEPPASDRR